MENEAVYSSNDSEKKETNPESPSKLDQNLDIKSTAVVTYTKMGPIETYSTLELNTDIKQPPENWLHDNLQGRFSSWTSAKHEPVELSSLNMAHTFPENIDEVDVISDAENIKKLLKMPFSETGISMSVNKVGRTLLLDKFDVQTLLSQAAQDESLDTLTWLQDFFSEEANIEKGQTALPKKKNPNEIRERSMMSKFLCYSLPEDSIGTLGEERPLSYTEQSEKAFGGTSKSPIHAKAATNTCKALVPFLPEPILKPHEKSPFQRNVLWKFEDTKMLIGSNMPIFGGGKYPAVSLRLKDCSKPINVLTGLDYWLDNLMCNVPEVVMCFHLDGIVQKYEHYKTDELPNIEGSQFSPGVIKDVARNILSFLKSNCTLEGHTYWLFKGNGSDVVKLYDLTSLYDKTADDESTNPFSVPVAMLLYRVAKNMISELTISSRECDMVHVLLTNCLKLLNNEAHPDDHLEIITSAHYLLAEVYSLGKNNGVDDLLENTNDSSEAEGGGGNDEGFSWPKTLTINDLSRSNDFEETYEEVSVDLPNDVNEKLHLSLTHVVKALKNLRGAWGDRKFSNPNNDKRNNLLPSRLYHLALPDAGFREISGSEFLSLPGEGETIGKASPLNFNFRQWQGTFESVLIHKAAALYADLASLAQAHDAHGLVLRYSRLSLGCLSSYRSMEWVNSSQELDLLPTIHRGCGDVFLTMARSRELEKCLEECERDYGGLTESDQYFHDNFGSVDDALYRLNIEFIPDVEKLMMKSLGFYTRALDVITSEQQVDLLVQLTKRLGNVRNELGLFCMNTAVKKSAGAPQETVDEVRELWKKSLDFFSAGVRAFQALDDRVNIALLYSNSGRLMRICSQTIFNTPARCGTFEAQEKAYYSSAIEFYQKSLRTLRERKSYPEIWDRVSWELSGTYYTLGTLIQDFTSTVDVVPEQCEREVSDWMFKALKFCEALECSSEQKKRDVQNRIGIIHYRLGSLYHHSYRMPSTCDQNAKKKKHLAELHYDKALDHLDAAMFPCEWLRTSLERVALLEHQLSGARGKGSGSIKILETILELLLNSQTVFEKVTKNDESSRKGDKNDGGGKSANACAKITETTFSINDAINDGERGGKTSAKVDATSASGFSLKYESAANDTASVGNRKQNSASIFSFRELDEMAADLATEEKSKEFARLLGIFELRLKNCLKEFVKISSTAKGTSSPFQKRKRDVLKRMFELTLRAGVSSIEGDDLSVRCAKMLGTIIALKKLSVDI